MKVLCRLMNLAQYTRLPLGSVRGWTGCTLDRCCILRHLICHTANTNPPPFHWSTCGETMKEADHFPLTFTDVKPL